VFVAFIGVVGFLVAAVAISATVSVRTGVLVALAVGGACGLTAALPALFGTLPGPPVRAAVRFGREGGPREGVRSALSGGLAPGVVVGVVTTLVSNAVAGLVLGAVAGLAGGFIVGLVRWSSPAEQATAATPGSVLRDDRRNVATQFAVSSVALGLVIGLAFGHGWGWRAGLFVGATGGIALAFGFVSGTAWMWYQAVHGWLALRGRLPWRLMDFLADAHARGVLRQGGSVYQFRHGRLQDRLAGRVALPHTGDRVARELVALRELLALTESERLLTAPGAPLALDQFPAAELRMWRELERHKTGLREELQAVLRAAGPEGYPAGTNQEARLREILRAEVEAAISRRTSARGASGRVRPG
jgi:hypothetical protein